MPISHHIYFCYACVGAFSSFMFMLPLSYKHPKGKLIFIVSLQSPAFTAAYTIEKWLMVKSLLVMS